MNVKDILAKIKAEFSAFETPGTIAPAVPAAPAVAPVAPVALAGPKDYTTADGVVISITQAGDVPAAGDAVAIAGAPAPDGVYVLEDGTSITTAAGIISLVEAAPPVTNTLESAPPIPTLEERISAIEAAIARATQPAHMSADDLKKLEEKFEAKYGKTIKDLFDLVEKIGAEPTAVPATLPSSQSEKFKRAQDKEDKIRGYADAITQINKTK